MRGRRRAVLYLAALGGIAAGTGCISDHPPHGGFNIPVPVFLKAPPPRHRGELNPVSERPVPAGHVRVEVTVLLAPDGVVRDRRPCVDIESAYALQPRQFSEELAAWSAGPGVNPVQLPAASVTIGAWAHVTATLGDQVSAGVRVTDLQTNGASTIEVHVSRIHAGRTLPEAFGTGSGHLLLISDPSPDGLRVVALVASTWVPGGTR